VPLIAPQFIANLNNKHCEVMSYMAATLPTTSNLTYVLVFYANYMIKYCNYSYIF